MYQLRCENLCVGYEMRPVLKNLNLDICAGEYLCIVGENGSGKSTFMKTVLGLIPPVSGSISYGDGLEKNEIGYLPQQTVIQKDFPASVKEVVLSGCLGRSSGGFFYGREEKQRVRRAMEKMQILDLAKRCYRELSGGQQQRVLLARALCATRKMLFLDEPVSGLDPETTREMYRLIERLNREEQITVIMISHDIEAAQTYASHILDMKTLVKRENMQRKERLQSQDATEKENPVNTAVGKGGADIWQN